MQGLNATVVDGGHDGARPSSLMPLAHWPVQERRGLVGVFTDIDDTLTHQGQVAPDALKALHDLKAASLAIVAITGRPIGWCAPLANGDAALSMPAWPVDAVVAENGAVAWVGPAGQRQKVYQHSASVRARNRARMRAIGQRIEREVPGAQITRDSTERETDLAIDHAEFASLGADQINRVVALMQAEGMHTTVSSIHIHGCFGLFDKWQGALWITQQLWGRSLAAELDNWVCVGDSGNDEAMFAHFRHSVGVANISRVADSLSHLPRFITPSEHGSGFAEVAAAILSART
jgi:HAD superfamily hydrolase (TIGR01484 family)